jgi:hypothetical protein
MLALEVTMSKLTEVLTPDAILAIYRELGKRPLVGGFFDQGNNLGIPQDFDCCCPIGAVMCKQHLPDQCLDTLAANLGLIDHQELWAFINGYDGDGFDIPNYWNSAECPPETFVTLMREAYELGVRTRGYLQGVFGPLKDLNQISAESEPYEDD